MKTEDIRNILAVQAIEETDSEGRILSTEDKREAAAVAGAPLPVKCERPEENRFLASRAGILSRKTTSRHPQSSRWLAESSAGRVRTGWAAAAVLLLAAAVGFLTNELGPEKRINILSFPLLGILLWSFAIYLREVLLVLLRRDRPERTGIVDWIANAFRRKDASPGHGNDSGDDPVLLEAGELFRTRWRRLTAPATAAKGKAFLHLAAFVLAASAIVGMYVKGLANEYLAVWESTFFTDGSQLRPFLHLVLGPAAGITGSAFPNAAELDAIRWTASEDGAVGESAARWIHWYALTVTIYVLVPRAVLAALWSLRSAHLSRTLPYRSVAPRFFEHLLATSSGMALSVRLVPYAYEPGETAKGILVRRLETHFSRAMVPEWLPPIPFGEEEEATLDSSSEAVEVLPVLPFSATPERETHLAVYQALSSASPNPIRSILLDASAFDLACANFPDPESRRKARENAWRALFQSEDVDLIIAPEAMPRNPPPKT